MENINNVRYIPADIKAEMIKRGYDISKYEMMQLSAVFRGIMLGLDVSVYDKPDVYDATQMNALSWALKMGTFRPEMADPKYTAGQMISFNGVLDAGLDIDRLLKLDLGSPIWARLFEITLVEMSDGDEEKALLEEVLKEVTLVTNGVVEDIDEVERDEDGFFYPETRIEDDDPEDENDA